MDASPADFPCGHSTPSFMMNAMPKPAVRSWLEGEQNKSRFFLDLSPGMEGLAFLLRQVLSLYNPHRMTITFSLKKLRT